jgi:hypothetical protein
MKNYNLNIRKLESALAQYAFRYIKIVIFSILWRSVSLTTSFRYCAIYFISVAAIASCSFVEIEPIMKILVVTPYLPYSNAPHGGGTILFALLCELAKHARDFLSHDA